MRAAEPSGEGIWGTRSCALPCTAQHCPSFRAPAAWLQAGSKHVETLLPPAEGWEGGAFYSAVAGVAVDVLGTLEAVVPSGTVEAPWPVSGGLARGSSLAPVPRGAVP